MKRLTALLLLLASLPALGLFEELEFTFHPEVSVYEAWDPQRGCRVFYLAQEDVYLLWYPAGDEVYLVEDEETFIYLGRGARLGALAHSEMLSDQNAPAPAGTAEPVAPDEGGADFAELLRARGWPLGEVTPAELGDAASSDD
ncbi:MAG: hypothetical protein GF399_06885 [Candidatus Coatesbacteria bacterium]|nr:hypothetical protein [Candidatus Coatesbacteria bacterium]